jgi:hypothetical protein
LQIRAARRALLAATAAEEGKKTVLMMLAVGGVFLAVIAIGELTHRWTSRRAERRRARRAVY